MLCNEVTRTRVQTTSKETACDEIYQRSGSEIRNESVVKDCLCYDIENVPTRQALAANECGAEGVEKYLECA